jgi:hypothetical protein
MTKTTTSTKTETVPVKLFVQELAPDRTPYKQYASKFSPIDLVLVIDVPKEFILQEGDDENNTHISMDGIAWMNDYISNANEKVHAQWQKEG